MLLNNITLEGVRAPVRCELTSALPLEHVILELIVLWDRMPSVADDKFGVVGKEINEMGNIPLQQSIHGEVLLKYRQLTIKIPTLPGEAFVFKKTQPSKFQGEHCVKIAKSCGKM